MGDTKTLCRRNVKGKAVPLQAQRVPGS